jgi:hypothetical protein
MRMLAMKPRTKTSNPKERGYVYGYRSGLEEKAGAQLQAAGIKVAYEAEQIGYIKPERKASYKPDFKLPNGIYIETKGRFLTADRQKHLLIQNQRPDLDIRFVFSNANARISKQSRTTYAMWCEKNGFKYATGTIPTEWIDE